MVAALKGGQVDSVLLPANQALGLEKDGSGKIIGWVHEHTPWQLGALFTSTKNTTEKRPMVQRFVKAYVRAAGDYAEAFHERDASGKRVFGPKADALIPILQKYVKPEPTADQVKASVSFIDPKGRLLVKNLYDQVAWYKAQGMVDAGADAKGMIDLGFVDGHLDLPK
jgi:NitT/TauT family transport system substrate-binding protein